MEASNEKRWKDRQRECLEMCLETRSGVLGIQEYWFKPAFREIYESKDGMGSRYAFYGLKRPSYKEDGLAFFIDRHQLEVVKFHELIYGYHGQRCALILHARLKKRSRGTSENRLKNLQNHNESEASSSASASGRDILIANTHLTFPHGRSDNDLRLKQAQRLLNAMEKLAVSGWDRKEGNVSGGMDMFVLGDFNGGGQSDAVYRLFKKYGYKSSFAAANGTEAPVTHLTHRGTKVSVDFIWFRPMSCNSGSRTIDVKAAYALPRGISTEDWPRSFTISDHRPVVAEFSISDLFTSTAQTIAGHAKPTEPISSSTNEKKNDFTRLSRVSLKRNRC
uniref:Endonuclease/exonuclease/phosphatase domain-containing protein n=1 Tax=Amorphochlora amoebiformis TaxID=1561963 RepID=A0A7S0CWQ3_9EUKA|mmetsp:Transcript_13945/g.22068  ORF Transcript_13945/g.22068 Transcript_13945/m.22068 type:complete len:335 (+) Transcript_13945:156-1160(+)